MKRTKKRSVKIAYKTDDKSFLIIVCGGFLVVLLMFVVFGISAKKPLSYTAYPADSDQMMQKENVVVIKDYAFSPASLIVKAGETVVFRNQDPVSHSATASDGSFTTGTIYQGGSGSVTFSKVGTYSYYSSTYPNVVGTIIVE